MPELPPSKRLPNTETSVQPGTVSADTVPYAELHCRTNFSFLEGASHADELVQTAHALGYQALAITDRNSLAGIVRAHTAAKSAGLKLLVGAEITPLDAPPLVLLATDRAAYGRLCRLLTRGRRNAPKGECRLTLVDIAEHAAGLLAGVLLRPYLAEHHSPRVNPDNSPGDRLGESDRAVSALPSASATLQRYREIFGDRGYALAELHHGPDDRRLLARMQHLANECRLPLVAANDVHYHEPQRRFLGDVLTAIREGCSVAELGYRRFPNAERYLKPPAQLAELFAGCPQALARTIEIASRCSFSLDELRYEYPEELSPPGVTPLAYLTQLTWQGARDRYPQGLSDKVRMLIEHELALIAELHYEAYFLTVYDLVKFARSRGILCQGRGSAANSAVCYCLGVTSVDPDRIDVLFERFISKERNEAPDIDVDFEHARREEVIQYVYDKYGRDRAAMTAEVICYRSKSAVREVGKALGLSLDRVDALAKSFEHYSDDARLARRFREAGFAPESRIGRQLAALIRQILDFPRHLSQHVGGLVITRGALCELCPIENASMPGRTVIEWDKDDLDALGILKVDCLALGMLTAIHKCFDFVEQCHQRPLTLANIPAEDPAVYDMVSQADTMGVFQIESRAQMAMLPRLRPREFYDLVIEVAIVRPGPIQGDMVHPYLRRRSGEEPVEFPDERIQAVLQKTLGVPIFQEQAMRLAVVAAGFTPGEADQLRRAMGAWRRPGVIDQFHKKLNEGMLAHGYSAEFADRLFRQIRGFGEYGFPESHAASFALLVYVSAWLKRYYPAAFAAALINSQPMGFYAPAQLIADARKHGVTVLSADVNFSHWDCTLESPPDTTTAPDASPDTVETGGPAGHTTGSLLPGASTCPLRLGLRLIAGLSPAHAERIVAARGDRPFGSLADFSRRTGLSNSVLTRLSRADAFRSLAPDRRSALWQSLPVQQTLPLFDDVADHEPVASLPALSPLEEVVADYRTQGLSLRDHPVKFVRPRLTELRAISSAELSQRQHNERVCVAGLVLMRQRPSTASGITFVTLEDETGIVNLIVHPTIWERYHQAARRAQALLARGTVQRRHEVIHVYVQRLQDLGPLLADASVKSRDFR
ncbi:MAG: error-prone DNA polymerase [Planctomycetes bacterium]|nr:error-prone DNA polymerase [Planctomycetota bacterium]